jgi:DNA-binding GntR family transcriptional regulator
VTNVTSLASRQAAQQRGTPLPGIGPLQITDRRQSRIAVQARVRELILDGTLPPGSVLSQVQLSRALGVSRTPLREALRMLQEEGLIDAEPNQRPRVRGFDSGDLESVYAIRILLESFAVGLTIPRLGPDDLAEAESALGRMRAASATKDLAAWRSAHREFHRILVSGAGEQVVQLIEYQAEQAQRYLRFYQLRDAQAWWSRDTEADHRHLLDAVKRDQWGSRTAVGAIGRHLARTALWVIAEADPTRDPLPIRLALQMALSAAEHGEARSAPRGAWLYVTPGEDQDSASEAATLSSPA